MVVGVVGMLAGTGEAASTDDVKINLFITPIVTTSLTVSPTYYDFESVDLKTSTGSTSALMLTNDGNVDFTVEKTVIAAGVWDVELSSTSKDGFILWAMVSDGQPNHAAFVTGESSFSNVGLGDLNDLTDSTKAQVSMSTDETKNLWFRLDMPYEVSTVVEQKLQIRLMATPK
jgi:hypothetical protein